MPKAPEGLSDEIVFKQGDYLGTEPTDASSELPRLTTLPQEEGELSDLARRFHSRLKDEKENESGWIELKEIDFPITEITHSLAWRAAQAFHALNVYMEKLGIEFQVGEEHGGIAYARDGESLSVSISEQYIAIDPKTGEPSPSSRYQKREKRPTGWLRLSLSNQYREEGRSVWNESPKQELEWIIPNMASRMDVVLRERYLDRLEEARWREEARRQEAIENHPILIEKHKKAIVSNLEKATYWWTRSEELRCFMEACQRHWESSQNGKLTKSQREWVEWASGAISQLSPLGKGYPNPETDGPIDYEALPVGGPYPQVTELLSIPSFEIVEEKRGYQGYGYSSSQKEYRYPFWLKHQG
ncbi:hypothetical protein H5P28_16895 [Ruficoccus amylovorans]|uniref:Uncharacterized protein n=1 Tax=Ruficoccus amylovorans TaxID=1804625 RepID=A0A842HGV0_9BACT|nr:hypothetical protein [Ruficoccus amylovorans]MBC2595945.1 hypothetical protein [Ruficoccus amylovorans]